MEKRTVIVNFSGGKDSTVAILEALKQYPKDEIVLCYQDTGAEYLETDGHVRKIAGMVDLPLIILRDDEGFWDRVKRYGGFPLPSTRRCTRQLKKDVLRKWVRQNRHSLGSELIIVSGHRAEESNARAKMDQWIVIPELTLKDSSFRAYGYLPCLNMSEKKIKERIKAEGLELHPCYEFSNRCSCWCCIFQPNAVVRTYAEMHTELYEQACLVEDEVKHKWKLQFGFNDLMKQGRLL